MDLAQRKKIELQQKLASLQRELTNWRDQSKAYAPLEKHQSQIHRMTIQLEGLNKQIESELSQLADTGPGVLSKARDLEVAMLESHRVWEFFRSKLTLRSIEWFNSYLIAADDLAWEGYSAAQLKLDPNYLAKDKVKEPPLVFFNGGSSPFTMPRDYAFQPEAVPGETIKTERVTEVLRALPIPVIGVPWFQIQHLPELLVVAHEVGHDVEFDFKLKGDVTSALNRATKIDIGRLPAWHAWSTEIFADIYGVLSCGPAFVQSLIDFLATDPDKTTQAVRTAANWGLYPTDYLRVLLNIKALDPNDFAQERQDLLAEWKAIYPSHGMPKYEDDIEAVVKAIIDGPYAAFGNSSLKDVISFTAEDQYYVNEDVVRLGNGGGPQALNVRRLFAAARAAFSKDPTEYGKLNMHKLILGHVSSIRKAGVRGSQTTLNVKLGSFDKEDTAAGESLFDILRKPSSE